MSTVWHGKVFETPHSLLALNHRRILGLVEETSDIDAACLAIHAHCVRREIHCLTILDATTLDRLRQPAMCLEGQTLQPRASPLSQFILGIPDRRRVLLLHGQGCSTRCLESLNSILDEKENVYDCTPLPDPAFNFTIIGIITRKHFEEEKFATPFFERLNLHVYLHEQFMILPPTILGETIQGIDSHNRPPTPEEARQHEILDLHDSEEWFEVLFHRLSIQNGSFVRRVGCVLEGATNRRVRTTVCLRNVPAAAMLYLRMCMVSTSRCLGVDLYDGTHPFVMRNLSIVTFRSYSAAELSVQLQGRALWLLPGGSRPYYSHESQGFNRFEAVVNYRTFHHLFDGCFVDPSRKLQSCGEIPTNTALVTSALTPSQWMRLLCDVKKVMSTIYVRCEVEVPPLFLTAAHRCSATVPLERRIYDNVHAFLNDYNNVRGGIVVECQESYLLVQYLTRFMRQPFVFVVTPQTEDDEFFECLSAVKESTGLRIDCTMRSFAKAILTDGADVIVMGLSSNMNLQRSLETLMHNTPYAFLNGVWYPIRSRIVFVVESLGDLSVTPGSVSLRITPEPSEENLRCCLSLLRHALPPTIQGFPLLQRIRRELGDTQCIAKAYRRVVLALFKCPRENEDRRDPFSGRSTYFYQKSLAYHTLIACPYHSEDIIKVSSRLPKLLDCILSFSDLRSFLWEIFSCFPPGFLWSPTSPFPRMREGDIVLSFVITALLAYVKAASPTKIAHYLFLFRGYSVPTMTWKFWLCHAKQKVSHRVVESILSYGYAALHASQGKQKAVLLRAITELHDPVVITLSGAIANHAESWRESTKLATWLQNPAKEGIRNPRARLLVIQDYDRCNPATWDILLTILKGTVRLRAGDSKVLPTTHFVLFIGSNAPTLNRNFVHHFVPLVTCRDDGLFGEEREYPLLYRVHRFLCHSAPFNEDDYHQAAQLTGHLAEGSEAAKALPRAMRVAVQDIYGGQVKYPHLDAVMGFLLPTMMGGYEHPNHPRLTFPVYRECSICRDDSSREISVWFTTLCNHSFHADCINRWSDSKSTLTCPLCREVRSVPAEKQSSRIEEVLPAEIDFGSLVSTFAEKKYNVREKEGSYTTTTSETFFLTSSTLPIARAVFDILQMRTSLMRPPAKLGLLIEGPSGRGKDVLLVNLFAALGYSEEGIPPKTSVVEADTENPKVFTHINAATGAGVQVLREKVTHAAHQGHILLVSELNLLDANFTESLFLDCLAHNVHPKFFLFATVNPCDTTKGRSSMTAALLSRFIYHVVEPYTEKELHDVIGVHISLSSEIKSQLVSYHRSVIDRLGTRLIVPSVRKLLWVADALRRGEGDLLSLLHQHYALYNLCEGNSSHGKKSSPPLVSSKPEWYPTIGKIFVAYSNALYESFGPELAPIAHDADVLRLTLCAERLLPRGWNWNRAPPGYAPPPTVPPNLDMYDLSQYVSALHFPLSVSEYECRRAAIENVNVLCRFMEYIKRVHMCSEEEHWRQAALMCESRAWDELLEELAFALTQEMSLRRELQVRPVYPIESLVVHNPAQEVFRFMVEEEPIEPVVIHPSEGEEEVRALHPPLHSVGALPSSFADFPSEVRFLIAKFLDTVDRTRFGATARENYKATEMCSFCLPMETFEACDVQFSAIAPQHGRQPLERHPIGEIVSPTHKPIPPRLEIYVNDYVEASTFHSAVTQLCWWVRPPSETTMLSEHEKTSLTVTIKGTENVASCISNKTHLALFVPTNYVPTKITVGGVVQPAELLQHKDAWLCPLTDTAMVGCPEVVWYTLMARHPSPVILPESSVFKVYMQNLHQLTPDDPPVFRKLYGIMKKCPSLASIQNAAPYATAELLLRSLIKCIENNFTISYVALGKRPEDEALLKEGCRITPATCAKLFVVLVRHILGSRTPVLLVFGTKPQHSTLYAEQQSWARVLLNGRWRDVDFADLRGWYEVQERDIGRVGSERQLHESDRFPLAVRWAFWAESGGTLREYARSSLPSTFFMESLALRQHYTTTHGRVNIERLAKGCADFFEITTLAEASGGLRKVAVVSYPPYSLLHNMLEYEFWRGLYNVGFLIEIWLLNAQNVPVERIKTTDVGDFFDALTRHPPELDENGTPKAVDIIGLTSQLTVEERDSIVVVDATTIAIALMTFAEAVLHELLAKEVPPRLDFLAAESHPFVCSDFHPARLQPHCTDLVLSKWREGSISSPLALPEVYRNIQTLHIFDNYIFSHMLVSINRVPVGYLTKLVFRNCTIDSTEWSLKQITKLEEVVLESCRIQVPEILFPDSVHTLRLSSASQIRKIDLSNLTGLQDLFLHFSDPITVCTILTPPGIGRGHVNPLVREELVRVVFQGTSAIGAGSCLPTLHVATHEDLCFFEARQASPSHVILRHRTHSVLPRLLRATRAQFLAEVDVAYSAVMLEFYQVLRTSPLAMTLSAVAKLSPRLHRESPGSAMVHTLVYRTFLTILDRHGTGSPLLMLHKIDQLFEHAAGYQCPILLSALSEASAESLLKLQSMPYFVAQGDLRVVIEAMLLQGSEEEERRFLLEKLHARFL